jgi:hypothetical protein
MEIVVRAVPFQPSRSGVRPDVHGCSLDVAGFFRRQDAPARRRYGADAPDFRGVQPELLPGVAVS